MSYSIRVKLDLLPPTVNHMYRPTRNGGKALTDEALSFRKIVAAMLHGQPAPPPGAPLVLSFWLTFPNKRRVDGDNRLKALQDAIALALKFDDSRIVEWHGFTAIGQAPEVEALLEVMP